MFTVNTFCPVTVDTLLRSCNNYELIIILLVLFNSVFETVLGLICLSVSISGFLSIPSFPRSIFFTSISLLIPLPVLAGRITTITSDRHSNTSFLDPLRGGDLISPQHSF